MDPNFPKAFGVILDMMIFVNSDDAHDLITCCSLTGLLAVVDSTPISWFSKCQGAVASSTFQAKFSALCMSIEEAQSLRYI